MSAEVVLVIGTDTGVGKTVTTAALAAQGVLAGRGVTVVKPVQTGVGGPDPDVPDVDEVTRLVGDAGPGSLSVREFVRLEAPLAPATAARLQGVQLPTVAEHAGRVAQLASRADLVLVEGAGGLLVRLDSAGGTALDLLLALRAAGVEPSVVLVVRAGLGTLNHTELTVRALRAAGVEPSGLVVGAWPDDPGLAECCNLADLPEVCGVPVLGRVPAGAGTLDAERFVDLTDAWFVDGPEGGRGQAHGDTFGRSA